MSTLKSRIALNGKRMSTGNHSNPSLREHAIYNVPEELPNARIRVMPGINTYETTYPIYTAKGRAILATAPGQWGQLYAAGNI